LAIIEDFNTAYGLKLHNLNGKHTDVKIQEKNYKLSASYILKDVRIGSMLTF
jgi:hypothetical protein